LSHGIPLLRTGTLRLMGNAATDALPPTIHPEHDKVPKRRPPDRSQVLRWFFQTLFLLLNLYIGLEFFRFVLYYESAGGSSWVSRPPGVEGWLPIASLMNLKLWILTGKVPAIHPAGVFLFISFATISLLLRKSFCGWLCPVGTISEWLWRMGRRLLGRNWALPRWLDIPLRSVKYLLLALFLYAVASMSLEALNEFAMSPYGLIADVKMLNFFRYLSFTAATVLIILAIASVAIRNFWCRYLCPYGALMGLLGWFSPLHIRRNPQRCIDCGKCGRECPASLPVDKLRIVQSPECMACFQCVAVCPARNALWMSAGTCARVPAWAIALGIAVIFFGIMGLARYTGHWRTNLPGELYMYLIPRAQQFSHP